jgi:hypothetical protein
MHTLQVTSAQQFGGTTSSGQRRDGLTVTCQYQNTKTELIMVSVSFLLMAAARAALQARYMVVRWHCHVTCCRHQAQSNLCCASMVDARLLVSWHMLIACCLYTGCIQAVRTAMCGGQAGWLAATCFGLSNSCLCSCLTQVTASHVVECCQHLSCYPQAQCCLYALHVHGPCHGSMQCQRALCRRSGAVKGTGSECAYYRQSTRLVVSKLRTY